MNVAFPTVVGRNYLLEFTDTLSATPAWTPLALNVTGNGSVQTFPIGPIDGFTKFFLRIRVAPSRHANPRAQRLAKKTGLRRRKLTARGATPPASAQITPDSQTRGSRTGPHDDTAPKKLSPIPARFPRV